MAKPSTPNHNETPIRQLQSPRLEPPPQTPHVAAWQGVVRCDILQRGYVDHLLQYTAVNYINTEEMSRAASRMESAAQDAYRAADRIEEATRKLQVLLEDGYGGNACRLIELLQDLKLPGE